MDIISRRYRNWESKDRAAKEPIHVVHITGLIVINSQKKNKNKMATVTMNKAQVWNEVRDQVHKHFWQVQNCLENVLLEL